MAIGHWLFAERWLLAIGYSRSVGYWLFAQCWLFVTPYYSSTEMSKIHFYFISFGGENVTLFRGTGVLTSNYSLSVNGNEISADKLVLATGSRPKCPNFEGPYWTSDDVFTLKKMPRSITIVGGGYIACELGHFFSGIGVETLQVVRGTKLLEREDEEIQALFQRGYTVQVPVRFETEVSAAKYNDSKFHIELAGRDGKSSERISDALLFCIGRIPNTDQIGFDKTD